MKKKTNKYSLWENNLPGAADCWYWQWSVGLKASSDYLEAIKNVKYHTFIPIKH